ncbi:ARM repeat-containing protein [Venustampulla echinocandica]|uniref:ARM repeat-containing protein n=1 Tax=Venustampulla echinocandica TaxID=2656787 RepID=A0A370TGZ8_9HELO|nr:ARM repeat-containing protein [Venustampulla echinocandica]RDL34472.1 ARM repeat-containing protein [Venustampulla echinocandica]
MSSARSEHLNLGYLPQPSSTSLPRSGSSTANTSPTEASSGSALRSPFGIPGGLNSAGKMAGNTRSGAGSPSHDLGSASRLFSKSRAREIQAQEGVPVNVWGPPTSGNSTPLRENIPESPTDGFPDFTHLPTPDSLPQVQTRRARAGTVPSRFSPGGVTTSGLGGLPSLVAKTSRPSPSPSPFKSPSPNLGDISDHSTASNAALLSRLRAGSMPQRPQYSNSTSPFGPSVFSSNWASGRERTSTLASIASQPSNGPSSPAQSSFSREGAGDNEMRTLDYLGLADTPQPPRAQLANPFLANIADLNKHANRFRSYSVNAKEKYEEEEDDDDYGSGGLTPYETQQAQLHMQLAATNAAIQQHNLAVQAFANQASSNRPRARTAGVLESPASRLLRNYYPTASRLDNSINASDIHMPESQEYEGLPEAVAAMTLGRSNSRNDGHLNPDDNLEGPTRALWLGSIPSSTTVSTLMEMFKSHGPIISARVLTHKNCGFVNFERLESAISAKALMNGKEIFPGAGPVRINFAKPPSPSGTPGHDGAFPSPSPDPFMMGENAAGGDGNGATPGVISRPGTASLSMPALRDMKTDILRIVGEFGASSDDKTKITHSLDQAIKYDRFEAEIPPIPEPSPNRVHDAPKLRDIRKRIDNQSWSASEIEGIAADMLPEIAELSPDYLGNTVVQKLFEHCSDEMRDAMLAEISPHMAEIGIHKNGTWAAQKIIDVSHTPKQMGMIVSNLQPYTVPLFLDQYGNYVLQCCLKFGSPYNDFIFEAMLSQMWKIAEGRYGARAMRACLESHHSTKDQQRMLAAAIALHSVQLATNANGALLLTWFLDTCTFPQRRTVLAPQLVPHLVHLCTHKVAYLTVLKVINQKAEPGARDTIYKALFFSPNDETLEAILADHACGATLIFKVLTTPFFDESIRSQVVEHVRNVLLRLKAQPAQGYKRLMDEVGLSTRNASAGPNREHASSSHSTERTRPSSNHSQMNGPAPQYGSQFYPGIQQPQFDANMGMQRADSVDSNLASFPTYGLQNAMFNPGNVFVPPASLQQYQQSLLARVAPPMNNYYPNVQSGFGYNNASPSAEHYRNQGLQNGSPIQPPQSNISPSPMLAQNQFAPPGLFGNMGMGLGAYGYAGMGMQGVGYGMQQEQPVNGRRGRR